MSLSAIYTCTGSRVVSGTPAGRQSKPRLQPEPWVVETKRIEDSAGSIEQELDAVFGPNEEGSCSGTTIHSVCENAQDKNNEAQSDNYNIATQESVSEDQDESTDLTKEKPLSPTTRLHTKEDISLPSFLLSEDQREENEHDFISREAHRLTQEILQESMCSFSRHSSIDPVNTNSTANSQSEAKSIDPVNTKSKANSHSEAKSIDTVNTNSTANSQSEAKSIDPVNINPTASLQPESMNMENKSLQSSLENMSNDECSSQDTNDHISTENNRPVSAVLSRKKNTFQFDSRPQSARVYSQNRTANSVVIDMTNLQSVEDT